MSEDWDGSDSSHPRHAANARSSDGPSLEQRREGDEASHYNWLALFMILGVVALIVVALYFLVQPSGMTMTK